MVKFWTRKRKREVKNTLKKVASVIVPIILTMAIESLKNGKGSTTKPAK